MFCHRPGYHRVCRARGGSLPRPWPSPVVHEVMPGFSAEGKDWTLTSCEVPHAQPYLECMAFRLETNKGVFVYSGDAGPCEELEALAEGADVLIHWCYRLAHETASAYIAARSPAPADIGAMAQRAGVKRLLLTHFRPHMDAPGVHEKVQSELARAFSGPAQIAGDLMEIEIG